jgi:hypothetical protein
LLAQRHVLSTAAPGMAQFGRLIAESPALLSRAREQREYLESAVARQLSEETGDRVVDGRTPVPVWIRVRLL